MPEIAAKEFDIPFFSEQGFTRRKCPNCGADYWSNSPGQRTCGEVPCQPYTFIGNPPTRRRYTVPEMRIQFMDYFAEKGHTRTRPYPVVARWRDDVYLVGASIYDFQPYVTGGTMPPPSNPLVISQPCIRFTDIESVGLQTSGRHMTIFEMGGAHAFNYPDKEIYWKDDCVRYHHQLLTGVVGVPADGVTYKEHFWSGGGNAGPDLEAIVAGLEISTLVFMQYRVEGDQLIPLPIRTVDTGYGIGRWSWLSQGSPSGFHAEHASVLSQVMDLAKLQIDETTVAALTRASGIYGSTIKTNKEKYAQTVTGETGIDPNKLQELLPCLDAAYTLTDHSKTIAFLLAEGLVPSNVGEGYLARLIIRRAARFARQIGIYEHVPSIVEEQIRLWGNDFRVLKDMRSEILEGLEVEMRKYQQTISRGSDAVVRLSKELSSKGINKIPVDQLVLLYDSQGISPEIVKEGAEKVGVVVEIPDNFLTLVAERHSRPHKVEAETREMHDLEANLQDLPPTRTLYYDNQYQTSFRAKVVARVADNAFVLDQTSFYPQGGGQLADHGELKFGEKKAKVIDVQKVGGTIIHYLDQPFDTVSDTVEGEIDWSRRQNLMRHHTGTHVLLGAARRVLGEHVWQAGAQKDVDSSRLDITHYSEISPKERERIESLANQVVLRDLPVHVSWMAREKAEAKYGYRLYQGGAVPGGKIRVVRIVGWDAEACGGTHVKRTGEIGVFKIEKIDRLQDGVERIVFSAGQPALKRINQYYDNVTKTSELLNTTPDRLPESVKSLLSERDAFEKELKKSRVKDLQSQLRHLLKTAQTIGPIRLVMAKLPKKKGVEPVDIANKLKESEPKMVAVVFEVSDRVQIVVAAGEEAVRAGINAGEIASAAAKVLGGGGGGRPFFATAGGSEREKTTEAMRIAEDTIAKQLGTPKTEQVS